LELDWRQQDVQDAVWLKLHLWLINARLWEPTSKLALHIGLQDFPWLHDSTLSYTFLPR